MSPLRCRGVTGREDAAVTQKIRKASEFLLVAEMALEMDAYDAAASLAVSAAINASDALLLHRSCVLPQAEDHRRAVTLLRQYGFVQASTQLSRILGVKNKAQYQVQSCTLKEAADAIQRTGRLLESVRGQV